MTLDFDCVFYYVSDLERSIAFYRDSLGIKLVSRDHVARFEVDGVRLELVPTSHGEPLGGHGNARLCLRVDDIAQAQAELQQRGVATTSAKDEGQGLLSRLHDPDGNEICLWQPKGSVEGRRSSIWL